MRVIVQRSNKASVSVNNKVVGKIDYGLVLLVGFTHSDTIDDINYMVDKILNLRIFDDDNGIMNKSIKDVNGSILSISQFTLYADTNHGRRPSYINAMKADEAIKMYDMFNKIIRDNKIIVETGIFGAEMEVNLINNGPVTIILERGENNGKQS